MRILGALLPLVSLLLSGCDDLPESAIRGYHFADPPNAAISKLQGGWTYADASFDRQNEIDEENPNTWGYFGCPKSPQTPIKKQLFFFGRQMSISVREFPDNECLNAKWELTIGKDIYPKSDESAMSQQFATLMVMGVMTVSIGHDAEANSANLCGLTSWNELDVVDVTGKTCLGMIVPTVPTDVISAQDSPIADTVDFLSPDADGHDRIQYGGVTYVRDDY
jgi:hypothetical protein